MMLHSGLQELHFLWALNMLKRKRSSFAQQRKAAVRWIAGTRQVESGDMIGEQIEL
jgi:hypothetical protein